MTTVSVFDIESVVERVVSHVERRMPSARSPRWKEAETAFLLGSLGYLSVEEISAHLPGRSVEAVKLKRQRDYLPASSKVPGWISATEAMRRLGMNDQRPITGWVHKKLVLGHIIKGKRGICLVHEVSLRRFAVNPMNWGYFDTGKVLDEGLRRLIARQKQRWPDEWLTTRQAANLVSMNTREIMRYVTMGRLDGVKLVNKDGRKSIHDAPTWSYWMVRKSQVLCMKKYKYGEAATHFTQAADSFLLLATAVGISASRMEALIGISDGSITKRLNRLFTTDQVQELIEKYGGKVSNKSSFLLADWRQFPGRFPRIERAARRFASGRPEKDDLYLLTLVLCNQARWHGIPLSKYGKVTIGRISRMADILRRHQIEPFL